MAGFRFREVLHGGFYMLAAPVDERPADMSLTIEVTDLTAFAGNFTARLAGSLDLDGFAREGHTEGTLVVDPEARRVTYKLPFRALDGSVHRLRGHKQLELLNLVDSFTLIRASIYDDAAYEVGRALLRFDVRGNWASLVRSLRPVF